MSIKTFSVRSMSAYRSVMLARSTAALKLFYGNNLSGLTLGQIKKDQVALRAYPELAACSMEEASTRAIRLRAGDISADELAAARAVKLAGEEMIEDAAAGEATRLGLGTKYLLTPERLVEALTLHNLRNPGNIISVPVTTQSLAPISLGARHKLQMVYDLIALANDNGLNPESVLATQTSLTILNEETALPILRDFVRFRHFGLTPERTLFLVQEKGLGMSLENGQLAFDPNSDFLLWNHGDMKTQQTLEGKVFFVRLNRQTGELERTFLTPEELEEIMAGMKNLISYPIEDLDYLTGSIDLNNLAVALRLGEQGYRMSMEGVAQKADPQKGGFFTYDPALDRVVCIESDCGGEVVVNDDKASLARIRLLNKNFNNFPQPVEAFRALARHDLPLHLTIKGNALYPQTPQGDQNFNLPTAFVVYDPVKQIRNLKVLSDGSATLEAMQSQDRQPGFLDLAKSLGLI